MRIYLETIVPQNYLKIKDGFTQELFMALTPPGMQVEVKHFGGCTSGDKVHVLVSNPVLKQTWVSKITHDHLNQAEWSFVDEGEVLPWPLTSWKHTHTVLSLGDKSSKIVDDIVFRCRFPWMEFFMYPILWSTFAIRPKRYRSYFKD